MLPDIRDIKQRVNKGQDYTFRVVPNTSLTAYTISLIAREITATGTGSVLSTATGVGAGSNLDLDLPMSTYDNGDYYIEVWSDYEGAAQKLLFPFENQTFTLTVQDRVGT